MSPKGLVKNMEMKQEGVERQIKTVRGWRLMARAGWSVCDVALCVCLYLFMCLNCSPLRKREREIRLMATMIESLPGLSSAVHFKSFNSYFSVVSKAFFVDGGRTCRIETDQCMHAIQNNGGQKHLF